MCCRSYHIGDDGKSAEINQHHKPTEDIQHSTPTQPNAYPLTKYPKENL